jgi:predicted enzyme related to lactoylglutathione lyase
MNNKTKILGLRTCIYKVSDLEKAKEWYSKVLETYPYFDESFYIGFNVEGYELGLIPDDKKIESNSENINVYWGIEDIEESYKKLLNLGAIESTPPHDVGGGIKVATVKDPWDNIFGIIYNPHFKLPIN